jgi:CheY-like chemotaxis protein
MEHPGGKQVHLPYRRGERRRKPFTGGQSQQDSHAGAPGPRRSVQEGVLPLQGVVLLVEPEDVLRWSLSDVLVQEGYAVAEAATAARALELLKQMDFDAMMLDLRLPEQIGWSFLYALTRSATLPAPLLLLPASAEPGEHFAHSKLYPQEAAPEQDHVTGRRHTATPSAMPGKQTEVEVHFSQRSCLPYPAWIEDLLALLQRIRPALLFKERVHQEGGMGKV